MLHLGRLRIKDIDMNSIKSFGLFVMTLLLGGFYIPAHAQTSQKTVIDTSLFSGMKFRLAGPFRGGRSTAVAGFTSDPFTFLMGSTGGGIWKTDDAGSSWA
ncbi:MAG: hypothetical protein R3250_08420, partial [Melioribacteraceae bacterium]|nr:hypothetical protein [Melioribacteraceae bacterium]